MAQVVRSVLVSSAALLIAAGWNAPALAQAPTVAVYRIAPQPLGPALKAFARENGVQILFAEADVAGRTTRGLNGRFTRMDALRRLVSGSNLIIAQAGPNTFVVRGGTTASAPALARQAQSTELQQPSRPTSEAEQTATADTQAAPVDVPIEEEEVVVTGIRSSLQRAANIKRNAVQVVDSIVAEDIGKLPDPTTAAALQRVPGVQVTVDRNNEISNVVIRGLGDILTTVDGREVFSTTGRSFDLQDLPAEALARIDVVKSQTADIIEGGIAGVIDLRLNKPFNFREPTIVLTARGNYAVRADSVNPQFGVLLADRWDTGIGEIGALLNVTWSETFADRSQTNLTDRRSSLSTPANSLIVPAGTPGVLVPNILQNISDSGTYRRPQANVALQWQVTPEVQAYVDALYTKYTSEVTFTGFNAQPFTRGVRLTDVQPSGNCFDARVNPANGQNPRVVRRANNPADPNDDTFELEPFRVQNLCEFDRATFQNIVVNQTTQARDIDATNRLIAGGLRFDEGPARAFVEASYQKSRNTSEVVIVDVGQRLPNLVVESDVNGGARFTVQPADLLLTGTSGLFLRNALQQQFSDGEGDLLAVRAQGEYDLGGFVRSLQFGLRYADRGAEFNAVLFNRQAPGGVFGGATESTAVSAAQAGLPPRFLTLSPPAPRLNGGAPFYTPNPDFLRSEAGREALRAVYGAPSGRPAFEPQRRFQASEQTLASYGQVAYEADFGGDMRLDGVVGVRLTRTDRTIAGATAVSVPASGNTPARTDVIPVERSTTDTDILPNATARLDFGNGFQTRFSYSKAIRRPEFGALNPGLSYFFQNNPFVLSTGTAGNPDLRPQKSDSYDATAEYYFGNGFAAVAGFYRTIKDRVITSADLETIDGITYSISRPRNVGEAELKGVELSGQLFFDFLPGALSGLGTFGAFTYVDSEVKGGDPLSGETLQGVSKYNYSAGLLYDKFGISGRLVYTYRSKYYEGDATGSTSLRPFDEARVNDVFVPTLLRFVRPAGRLDFSLGYELTDAVRVDVGGVNILKQSTRTYWGEPFVNESLRGDETTYTLGLRVRL